MVTLPHPSPDHLLAVLPPHGAYDLLAILPPHQTHLLLRWVHVVAMATLLGGALLCWGRLRPGAPEPTGDALGLAATYEWLFWAGAGLLVLTGVGNLGALAPAVPGAGTSWGVAFAAKLLGVVVLLAGSLVRTLGVLVLAAAVASRGGGTVERLRVGYAATALLLVGVVALAEVMAHG